MNSYKNQHQVLSYKNMIKLKLVFLIFFPFISHSINKEKVTIKCRSVVQGLSEQMMKIFQKNDGKDIQNSIYSRKLQEAYLGSVDATYELGFMNYAGLHGVKKDFGKALSFFKEAADKGHLIAPLFLTRMYINGEGVKQDFDKALSLLKAKADQGLVIAQLLLGYIYLKNDSGATQEAFHWFKKAAGYGRVITTHQIPPYSAIRDLHTVFNVLEIFADREGVQMPEYEYIVATMYHRGQGLEEDINQALRLALKEKIDKKLSESEETRIFNLVKESAEQINEAAQEYLKFIESEKKKSSDSTIFL